MKRETIVSVEAMNELAFFALNVQYQRYDEGYAPCFIVGANWKCDRLHILSKWRNFIGVYNEPTAVLELYTSLDNENRIAMMTWICENYKSGRNLDFDEYGKE